MKQSLPSTIKLLTPSILLTSSLLLPLAAQNTLTWTGTTDGNWNTASNWSGAGSSPGTNPADIANFDSASSNTDLSLGTATTIRKLEFVNGAASYTLSGETLTISRNSGVFIEHNAGNEQTINALVVLNATAIEGNTRFLSVGSGSTLNLTNGINLARSGTATDNNLNISGGGTVTMGKAFGTLNTLTVSGAGTTLNYRGGGSRVKAAAGARVNIYSTTYGSLDLEGADASIYARSSGLVAGANSFDVRASAGNTVTFGADIAGGGTATYNRTINLNRNGSVNNATMRFDAKAGSVLDLSGVVQDYNNQAGGAGTVVEITGEGAVRFSGTTANTSVTPIVVTDEGTLELAKTENVNAIAGGSVTLQSTGTLSLLASHQIADSTALILDGGSFNVNNFSETLGDLSVTVNGGFIQFSGDGGILVFSALNSIENMLTINGWNENISIVFTDGSGWDTETLARVNFVGYGQAMFDSASGTLYAAVPEPTTTALLSGAFCTALALIARRRKQAAGK